MYRFIVEHILNNFYWVQLQINFSETGYRLVCIIYTKSIVIKMRKTINNISTQKLAWEYTSYLLLN